MKLELDVNLAAVAEQISRTVTTALGKAADESVRYGSLGRDVKEAAENAARLMAAEVLREPGFREECKAALKRGILRGIEQRGEKVARGMNVQAALALGGTP